MAFVSSPVLMALGGVVLGTVLDALVKGFASELPVLTIITWRFVFGAVITVGIYLAAGHRWPSIAAIRFHLLRSVFLAIAAVSFFWAVTQLALVEAIVLGFTAGLMIPPIARVLLGERMSPVFVGAGLVGFVGAAFATTGAVSHAPPDGQRALGFAAVLVTAFSYALSLVLLRLAARRGDAITTLMFNNVGPIIYIVPLLFLVSSVNDSGAIPIVPTLSQMGVIIGLAVVGVATWWLLTQAYAKAEAQQLAPLDYSALVWSAGIGIIAFGEIPTLRLYFGAGLIILACLVVAFESRFVTRRETRLPPTDAPG